MARRWRVRPHDPTNTAAFARKLGVPPLIAQLLLARGVAADDQARLFLESKLTQLRDPDELPGVTAASERLHRAAVEKRKIVIYGDYDVDGITGTSLLYLGLKLLGADVRYHVPHRVDDGYGLHGSTLGQLAEDGAKVVVTVDCGITAVDEARLAEKLGLELIISDHHHPGPELPSAAELVHPSLPGTTYPFAGLCGSAVALKLAWAVCRLASGAKRVSEPMRDYLLRAVSFAALGTVADVVPLVDENRVLVRHGLVSLRQNPTPGMAALMQVANLTEKSALESEDLAFGVAPRLNAAGRLGTAQLAVELLTTDDADKAMKLAVYLNELNESRQKLERSIYLAAKKQAEEQFDPENDPALVLADPGWHPGVIGIVAGRLAERFGRPVALIALDKRGQQPGTGSMRSVPGVDLFAALSACRDELVTFGGHAAAAGVKVEESRLPAFRAALCEWLASEVRPEVFEQDLLIDGEAPLSAFTLPLLEQMDQLAPFGAGNQRPLWCTAGVTLARPPKKMGGGDRHLDLFVAQHSIRMRAVGFGRGEWAEELEAQHGPIDLAFRPVINEFRGRRNVELHLVDWRPSSLT